jgi:hypothetical protein
MLAYPKLSTLCLKCRPVSLSKHNVSETEFCLHLQVKPTQLGQIDRAEPEDGDRIQFPKRVLTEKQDNILNKDKTMDNVQKRTNVPLSQTFRSNLVYSVQVS